MTAASTSPDRGTFQKNGYLERAISEGKSVEDAEVKKMLDWYETWESIDPMNLTDPEWQEHNLEWTLRTTDWILDKVRTNRVYGQNLYAALCNNEFTELDVIEVLKDNRWSCSWRHAGGVVANMRGEGDYIDWYCSGINGGYGPEDERLVGYVSESVVTEEVKQDLHRLGWVVNNG